MNFCVQDWLSSLARNNNTARFRAPLSNVTVIRERFNIDGSTFPTRMVPSHPYPSPVLSTMVLSVRSLRVQKKEKVCTHVKSDRPAGIFTDHLADGIFGSSIPGIFDNNARKLER